MWIKRELGILTLAVLCLLTSGISALALESNPKDCPYLKRDGRHWFTREISSRPVEQKMSGDPKPQWKEAPSDTKYTGRNCYRAGAFPYTKPEETLAWKKSVTVTAEISRDLVVAATIKLIEATISNGYKFGVGGTFETSGSTKSAEKTYTPNVGYKADYINRKGTKIYTAEYQIIEQRIMGCRGCYTQTIVDEPGGPLCTYTRKTTQQTDEVLPGATDDDCCFCKEENAKKK